jgi:hypothetical protein
LAEVVGRVVGKVVAGNALLFRDFNGIEAYLFNYYSTT